MADTEVKIEIQAETKQAVESVEEVKEAVQEMPQGFQDAVKATAQSSGAIQKHLQKILSVVQSLRAKIAKPFKMVFDSAPMVKLRSRVQKTTASIQNMNTALRAVTGVAAIGSITAIGSAIVGLGVSAVNTASKFAAFESAFGTMLGDMEQGKQLFQDVENFAIESPFDIEGAAKSAQLLLGYGQKAEDIIPIMQILGDTAAGANADLEGLALVFGQIGASATLNAQDMNQLVNQGVAAYQILSDKMGITVDELKDKMSQGAVSSSEALGMLAEALHEKFGGAMENMNQTVGGLWNGIQESAVVALSVIGDYLVDTFDIKGVLTTVSNALGNVISSLREARKAGKSFSEAILDAVPKPVLVALGSLVSVIGAGLVGACAAGAIAMWSLIAPVLPIVAAIAGIGIAITALYVYWDDLVDIAKDVGSKIVNTFVAVAVAIVSAIFAAVGSIVAFFTGAAANIVAAVEAMITAACGYCPQFITSFREMLDEVFGYVKRFVNDCLGELAKVFAAQEAVKANAGGGTGGETGGDTEEKGGQTVEEFLAKLKGGLASLGGGGHSGGGGSYGGGGGGGAGSTVDMNARQQEQEMKRVEQEVNRVTEALAKASGQAQTLTMDFQKLTQNINFEGMTGADAVFEGIKRETQARIDGINQVLQKEAQAVDEAEALKKSAEETGNAEAIARATAQYKALEALHQQHLEKKTALEDQVQAQQAAKALQLDTQLKAAQAEAQAAMNAANMEQFMEYLEGEGAARLAALEEEQALRQQLYDWRMESERSIQDFALEAANTLKNQLAEGFAELVTAGGSFSDKLKDITKNIVQMFVKYVAQKQIADLYVKLAGNKQNKENIKNNIAEAKSLIPAAVDKCIAQVGVGGGAMYSMAHEIGMAAGLASLSVSAFAKGGRAKGWSIVGEEGPELVNFTHPGRVYTADETAAAMQGFNPDLLSMTSGASPSTAYINSGAGSAVTVSAVQNIYGGINSGMDEEDAFSFFSDAIMQGVKAT